MLAYLVCNFHWQQMQTWMWNLKKMLTVARFIGAGFWIDFETAKHLFLCSDKPIVYDKSICYLKLKGHVYFVGYSRLSRLVPGGNGIYVSGFFFKVIFLDVSKCWWFVSVWISMRLNWGRGIHVCRRNVLLWIKETFTYILTI